MLQRLTFLLASLALLLLNLTSCENHFRKFAPANPAPGTRTSWPPTSYAYVKAFCYDYKAGPSATFLENGKMHPGVMDSQGVRLSTNQVQRLLDAATISQAKSTRTPCYAPHHAFVFYNARGEDVAVFEMCFGCNSQRFYPAGGPEYVNRAALWELTAELGLPLGTSNDFYTKAVRDYRIGRN
jgi:hypothetical protein